MDDLSKYRNFVDNKTGAERTWAYVSWVNLRDGYYSPNELIDLVLQNDFKLDNPFMKIRRGTQINQGAELKNGTIIDGSEISIGEKTVLDQARIVGSKICIGKQNLISSNLTCDL